MNEVSEPEAWESLRRELVFESKWLSLVSERVRLPNGHEAEYIRFADDRDGRAALRAVLAIALRADGDILVSKQWNLGINQTSYEFPAGGVEDGEDPLDALRREVMEETGWTLGTAKKIGTFENEVRRSSLRSDVYVTSLEACGQSVPEPGEVITHEFLSPAQITERIRTGHIRNSTFLAAWALYLASP